MYQFNLKIFVRSSDTIGEGGMMEQAFPLKLFGAPPNDTVFTMSKKREEKRTLGRKIHNFLSSTDYNLVMLITKNSLDLKLM